MVDLERTIHIIFAGDDQTSPAFNAVSAQLGDLKGNIEAVADRLAGVADNVLKFDAAMAALAVGGLAYSIAKAGEFNSATAQISTVINGATFDMGRYREAILEYAQGSTQSISTITGTLYEAIQAGVSWEDSIRSLAVAEQLAVASNAGLLESNKLLLSVMAAYGAGLDEAGRYADVFFKTVDIGNTTIPELAQNLSSVTSIAAGAKIPIETVAAAIADLTAKGFPTAEAITAIRAAITEIINPSAEAAKAAKALGIEFGASALESKGLEGVLMDVYRATGGNVETMSQLFGNVRGLTGVMALFGQDGGNAFLSKLEEMRNSGGAVEAAYAKMVENISYQNQMLINTMEATFIKIGQPLLDEYGSIVKALGELFKGLNISLDAGAFDPVFDMLQQFGNELAGYIDGIARALPQALGSVDFTAFTNALRGLGEAFGRYLGDLDLTAPEDLGKAIQILINIISGLINLTTGMVEAFRPFVQQVAEFLIKLSEGDAEAQKFAGTILTYAKVISESGLLIAGAMVAMQEAGVKTADAMDATGNSASFFGSAVSIGFQGMALSVVEAARAVNLALNIMSLGLSDYYKNNEIQLKEMEISLINSMKLNADEAIVALDDWGSAMNKMLGETDETRAGIEYFGMSLQDAMGAARDASNEVGTFTTALGNIPDETMTEITARINEASLTEAEQAIIGYIPDEKSVTIYSEADSPSSHLVGTQLDTMASPRTAAIQPTVDKAEIERIKGQFETIQTAMEWKAKLDIADVEANAKIIEAIAGTLSTVFQSSADIISSALGAWEKTSLTSLSRSFLESTISQELDLRERAMRSTEDLANAQIDYMNAKMRAMDRGDALIQIDGAGLQPELEAFMWKILEAIQVRVNEEGHAMLFGI